MLRTLTNSIIRYRKALGIEACASRSLGSAISTTSKIPTSFRFSVRHSSSNSSSSHASHIHSASSGTPLSSTPPSSASISTAASPLSVSRGTSFSPAMSSTPVISADGMPRWPTISSPNGILRGLDWVGTVSFAHSGAVLAASGGMDLLGSAVIGTITAVGGGTIRDALFLSKRPFWTEEPEYIYLCLATSALTFLFWPSLRDSIDEDSDPLLFTGDTLGVGAFCVIGAMNGVRAAMPVPVSLICGISTATFGGAVRDVLCKKDVRILHSHAEIYATTAAGGASAFIAARALGASPGVRIAAGVLTGVALRCMAWMGGIRLPVWERPVEEERRRTVMEEGI